MHKITLVGGEQRQRAQKLILRAPDGYVVTLSEPKRSREQNDRMWAMLTDISHQKPMGRMHTPDDWKAIFMNACGWECQFLEGLDGRPFPQGFRSSQMTKRQMSAMIEYMLAFGAEHNIRWSEPQTLAA
ncbi:recombination protein NinB [Sphingopyxis sp. Geo48]|uniref:recombination protein NinB n=1 Tax=Sphingopyxis sp. Geo48 TaxID=545241 RepID=UPI0024B70870|nr:recombination protein NinB [Sphingopyxis sp. Geo48]